MTKKKNNQTDTNKTDIEHDETESIEYEGLAYALNFLVEIIGKNSVSLQDGRTNINLTEDQCALALACLVRMGALTKERALRYPLKNRQAKEALEDIIHDKPDSDKRLWFEENDRHSKALGALFRWLMANIPEDGQIPSDNKGFALPQLLRRLPNEQTSLFPEDELIIHQQMEILTTLPRLLSIIPRKHLIPHDKLTNTMTKDILDVGRVAIEVSRPKAKKSVNLICSLIYEGDKVQISGRRPFTEYDRNVYNAVSSLFVLGDQSHIVTPDIVYRAMTGMDATEDPSPQQTGAITRSLDKMRFIRVTVDCTEELNQRRMALTSDYITKGIIDTYLLNASVVQVQTGSKSIRAYKIEKTPVLYAYSNALNQVYTVPANLLDIKTVNPETGKADGGRISNTESRIQIKGYLLRRVEGMKGDNGLDNNVISLKSYERNGRHHPGLYEIAGKEEPSTKDATRIRSYVTQVLDYWKTENYIKDYSWKKQGNRIVGLEIFP